MSSKSTTQIIDNCGVSMERLYQWRKLAREPAAHLSQLLSQDELTLDQLSSVVAFYDSDISLINSARRLLERQLAFLLKAQERRSSILRGQGMAMLPTEVLGSIFALAADGFGGSRMWKWPGRLDCVSISQVCQRWRIIALATPRIWTYIPVHACISGRYISLLLERSKACLLRLEINIPEHGKVVHTQLHSLMEKCNDMSSRWEALHFRWEALHFRGWREVLYEIEEDFGRLYAPKLRLLRHSSPTSDFKPLLRDFHHSFRDHIVNLEIPAGTVSELLTTLSGFPNLEVANFEVVPTYGVEPVGGQVIIAPCLQILRICSRAGDWRPLVDFLQSLTAPKLNRIDLTLQFNAYGSREARSLQLSVTGIIGLNDITHCTIRAAEDYRHDDPGKLRERLLEMTRIITHFNSITCLEFVKLPIPQLLSALTDHPPTRFLPNLRTLVLRDGKFLEDPRAPNALAAMLRSRKQYFEECAITRLVLIGSGIIKAKPFEDVTREEKCRLSWLYL